MSVKTRLEALEKRLAKPEQEEETIITIRLIEIRTREELLRLQAQGMLDTRPPRIPPGRRARLVLENADAKDVPGKAEPV